jgi:hypothetical protein
MGINATAKMFPNGAHYELRSGIYHMGIVKEAAADVSSGRGIASRRAAEVVCARYDALVAEMQRLLDVATASASNEPTADMLACLGEAAFYWMHIHVQAYAARQEAAGRPGYDGVMPE